MGKDKKTGAVKQKKNIRTMFSETIENIAERTENAASKKNLWFYFMLLSMAILTLTVIVASTLSRLVNQLLNTDIEISIYAWTILFSILIGGTMSMIIGRIIFVPILKLSSAMKKVAAGDFGVRLDLKSSVNEIGLMIENFNKMTKELAATEMLQSDFVSNVSHEFKTPISVIEGYATLLQDEKISEAEKKEYIEKIMYNTDRLNDLVGNVLLLSKVENRGIPTSNDYYRLDEQIRQCIVLLSPKWEEKGIEFSLSLPETEYYGSSSLLQHVWVNLIGNAIKFNRQNGKIIISLTSERDKIKVSVADEGCGIAEDSLPHLYDKFYQGDSSHKSDGNGLGLSLIKRILDGIGGGIQAKNREEVGAEFTVELPIINQ